MPWEALGGELVFPMVLLAALGDLSPDDEPLDHERHQDRQDEASQAEDRGDVPVEQPRDAAGDRCPDQADPACLGPVDRALADEELRDPPGGERNPEHREEHDQSDHRAAG